MDYRQLQAFIAVFENRNITAAARALHLSQPALSGSIKLLEDRLGTTLFVRQARGVEVTEDGRALYPEACRMVADATNLLTRFKRGQQGQPLKIGVEPDISAQVLQMLIHTAAQLDPPVMVQLAVGCQGEVRLASEDLRCEDELFLPLSNERFVVALPQAADGTADPAVREQGRWITCPGLSSHQRLLPLYGSAASAPVAEAETFTLALSLVAAGVGAAFVPETLAAGYAGVAAQEVPQLDLRRRIGLCYPVQSLAATAIVQLKEALASMAG